MSPDISFPQTAGGLFTFPYMRPETASIRLLTWLSVKSVFEIMTSSTRARNTNWVSRRSFCDCVACFKIVLVNLVTIILNLLTSKFNSWMVGYLEILYIKRMTAEFIGFISRAFLEYFRTTDSICMPWNWTKPWKLYFATSFCSISKVFPYYHENRIVYFFRIE